MSTATDLYEQDPHAWALHNATLLRQGRLAEIDAEHLAEELEDMGANKKRAIARHLMRLLQHLLKYKMQPQLRSKSWQLTIRNQREDLRELLEESPSLVHTLHDPERLRRAYARAVSEASIETGIDESVFPHECPFTVEQALKPDFWPEG
ncbi:MAG: DUF29 domain-containing protein [Candidatus Competibacteraceae bacterium]